RPRTRPGRAQPSPTPNATAPARNSVTTIATTRAQPRTSSGTTASKTMSIACQASEPVSMRIQLQARSGAATPTTRSDLPLRRLRPLAGPEALGQVVTVAQHRDRDAGRLQPQELGERLRGRAGKARCVDEHQRDASARQ